MQRSSWILIAACLCLVPLRAFASPVTLTYAFRATGTYSDGAIGPGSFTNQVVIFTATGDTAAINASPGLELLPVTTDLNIGGTDYGTLNGLIAFVLNNNEVGLGDLTQVIAPVDILLATPQPGYDLSTSLASVSGTLQPIGVASNSTIGVVRFTFDANTPATYVAAVTPSTPAVPEPSSLTLLSTGALGMAGALRRRFLRA